MSLEFNLIDEPWVPCLLEDVTQADLSLRQTLLRAHEITAVAGESPPVTAALHRLLLAILHRCAGWTRQTGPSDTDEWAALWGHGCFDSVAIASYLERWRDRFDLFDAQRPFFQTAAPAVDPSKASSIAKLLFQSDNNPTLFDHTLVAEPPRLLPAQAARLLIACQAFDTAGLITGTGDEKSAKAAPLLQCAVLLVRGKNLFQTLMLNLHRYSPSDGAPWDFDGAGDRPAWERDDPTLPGDRLPDGYLDLLTWQSRRIRLWPEKKDGATVAVRRATVMKGFQFPADWLRYGHETMVAFQARRKALPGQDPWPPLGFQEDRVLWRDSLALMESVEEKWALPKSFGWLAQLALAGVISRTERLPLDAVGLAADRAKLLFWRHERLVLPLPYLDEHQGPRLRQRLRDGLQLAEAVGTLLGSRFVEVIVVEKKFTVPSPLRLLAQELLGVNGPVDEFVRHLAPTRLYWVSLEDPFQQLLVALPADTAIDGAPATRWREALRSAALAAFAVATHGLDQSSRTIRATSLAERELRLRLHALLGPPLRSTVPIAGGGNTT